MKPSTRFFLVPALICTLLTAGCDVTPRAKRSQSDTASAEETPKAKAPKQAAARKDSASKGQRRVAEADEVRQVYYQYIDKSGTVQFVPTLEAVPPEWRSRVGFVEMTGPPSSTMGGAGKRSSGRSRPAQRMPAARAYADAEDGDGGGSRNNRVSIIMYGAEWCGACRAAKSYMDQQGIDYDERNVDDPSMLSEMESKAGRGGIPVFDVDGQILRGFSPDRLEALIRSAS